MLLDAALRRASDGELGFDRDGALGLAGEPCRQWLDEALAGDGFLALRPPKSTGRERYGAAFLDAHWARLSALSLPDLAATLAAQVVESVADAIARWVQERPAELVVSGGGARNRCVMAGLVERLAPMRVRDSEQALGVPVLAREALAFAVLADATLTGEAGNVPSVTRARRGVRLGKLCLPPTAGVSLPAMAEHPPGRP
jgi:anhydro-N-acetylmuramic acid kinase